MVENAIWVSVLLHLPRGSQDPFLTDDMIYAEHLTHTILSFFHSFIPFIVLEYKVIYKVPGTLASSHLSPLVS